MNKFIDKDSSKFLDIKASLFHNKKNGQISITLPKKQLKKMIDFENPESINPVKMPKKIPIRIFKWRNN
jgi:hypothetical protein